ncbi:MAG: hypothetical protein ABFS37_05510, partial [Acidobacteriota bacterium]
MNKGLLFVASVIAMIVAASLVVAQTPEGVEPGAWAKVEAQLEGQGVETRAKAGRDVPVEVAKLLPTPDLVGDEARFGRAIAIDGDTMVVSAFDCPQGYYAEAAYIFQSDEGGADAWELVAKLTAVDVLAVPSFGWSVAISGDSVVVGAQWDDDNGHRSGSAFIFGRNQGGADKWGLVAKLTALDGATYDYFGKSVSISGDTVVVGAYEDDDNGFGSGSVYIFDRNQGGAGAWGQVAKVTASDGASGDDFGISVSISGETVVVGARYDDENGSDSGTAYVFGRNQGGANAWGQVAKVTASDGAESDSFGNSVSISGGTVVVGAHGNDDYGSQSGSVYIFGRNHGGTDAWGQVTKLTASDGAENQYFGRAVSISGDTVIVGAYGDG